MPDLPLEPGAIAASTFLVIAVLLLVYALRHRARRLEELTVMMPQLGFAAVAEPSADELVPDLLFHPGGLAPPGEPAKKERYSDLMPRVPSAWTGRLAGSEIMVMDVVVTRTYGRSSGNPSKGSWTVLRCDPGQGPRPPDLLIAKRLFKSWAHGARSINGPVQLGGRYFLFSSAPDAELAPWITSRLREQLARHRLWTIAAHDGVFYLKFAASVYVMPDRMRQFLREGEAIIEGLFADYHR